MEVNTILYVVVIAAVSFYLYYKWLTSYWQRRGFPYLTDNSFFEDVNNKICRSYTAFKSKGFKFGGIFVFSKPAFIPIDLELIKNIMQRDFEHFVNRDLYVNEKAEPLGANLLGMKDESWKNLRAKLTPVFSSASLKGMFQTLAETTISLGDILEVHSVTNEPVHIKDLLDRFTTDVISSCAFGINCNSLKNPDSEFRQAGKKFAEGLKTRIAVNFLIPHGVLKFFNVRLMAASTEKFFIEAVKNIVEHREKNNIIRKDIMHLLIKLKNGGNITNDELFMNDDNKTANYFTINQIAAQCFVFFIAGFHTSATTMTMALLELALNQDIQNKLRSEIRAQLRETNGKMTYEAVKRMKYLDNVVNETLRKHPTVRFMLRLCNKDYKIPDTDCIIKQGTTVILPFNPIHHDPEYYPNPENFDPERFSDENIHKIKQFSFLPFGEGPRMCIGSRFGRLQTKVGIVAIIKDYKITVNAQTKQPIEFLDGPTPSIKGFLWLDIEKAD